MSGASWPLFSLLTAVLAALAAGVIRGQVLLRRRPKPKEAPKP